MAAYLRCLILERNAAANQMAAKRQVIECFVGSEALN
jgi:hypothetical protein